MKKWEIDLIIVGAVVVALMMVLLVGWYVSKRIFGVDLWKKAVDALPSGLKGFRFGKFNKVSPLNESSTKVSSDEGAVEVGQNQSMTTENQEVPQQSDLLKLMIEAKILKERQNNAEGERDRRREKREEACYDILEQANTQTAEVFHQVVDQTAEVFYQANSDYANGVINASHEFRGKINEVVEELDEQSCAVNKRFQTDVLSSSDNTSIDQQIAELRKQANIEKAERRRVYAIEQAVLKAEEDQVHEQLKDLIVDYVQVNSNAQRVRGSSFSSSDSGGEE